MTELVRIFQVFSIRAAATDNLAKLAKEFGADWAQEHLVPQACCLPLQTQSSFFMWELIS